MLSYKDFLNTKFAVGLNGGQLSFFKEFLDSTRNLFLTGGAGVGKSFILNRLSEFCEHQGIFLSKTSSTGVSAINIGAQTLHSYLGLGLADCSAKDLVLRVDKNKKAKQRIRDCKILFIDEISMVSGELLDKVVAVIKAFNWRMPRIIFSGDFLQLPPIFKSDSLFCFESDAWIALNPKIIHLTEIVRQDKESDFAHFLSKVRFGDKNDFSLLTPKIVKEAPNGCLVAYAKNIDVDSHNLEELNKLPGKITTYQAVDMGPDNLIDSLDKNCLAPRALQLKIGAQVMLLKNDLDNGLSNGSIGKVVAFGPTSVDVEFNSLRTTVQKHEWKIEEAYVSAEGKPKMRTLASRSQIPLRLAWANTIHKIQGFTVDKIMIDLSNCFAPGQAYVALSRARTLEGLYVKGFSAASIRVDPRCIEFYRNL